MADEPDNETPPTPDDPDAQAAEAKGASDPPVEESETTEVAATPEPEALEAEAPEAKVSEAEAPEAAVGPEADEGQDDLFQSAASGRALHFAVAAARTAMCVRSGTR